MDDPEGNGIVILVVGNLQDEKAGVADTIAKHAGWDQRTTSAGVRIFTNQSGDQVIDTTPLRNVQGRSPTAIARRWISQNSLREIVFGRMVFVLCVVTAAIVEEQCSTDVFVNCNCWLDVLELMFGTSRQKDVMVLVSSEGDAWSAKSINRVNRCLRRHNFLPENVLFSTSKTGNTTRASIEVSIRKTLPRFCSLSNEIFTFDKPPSTYGKPFVMERPSSAHSGRGRFGPWGPERVFLFGMTGSGKSTLAQMLTSGKLDQNATKFKASSGIRGKTVVIEHGEGRGWYVVDTPGFGEPASETSTVTTHAVEGTVKNFVEWQEGTFSHYLFVIKRDRIDDLEVKLWTFFKLFFGETILHHFSIVISNADQKWLEDNMSYLQTAFGGCSSFLAAEFPWNDDDDDEDLEREYHEMRTTSLQVLEEELAKLGRSDLVCKVGERSKMHRLNEKHRADIDAKIDRNTALVVDIVDKLGFVSTLTTVDDFIYRLYRTVSGKKINLVTL